MSARLWLTISLIVAAVVLSVAIHVLTNPKQSAKSNAVEQSTAVTAANEVGRVDQRASEGVRVSDDISQKIRSHVSSNTSTDPGSRAASDGIDADWRSGVERLRQLHASDSDTGQTEDSVREAGPSATKPNG